MDLHRKLASALALTHALVGCDRSESPGGASSATASPSAALSQSSPVPIAKLAKGVPLAVTEVEKVVNPKREQAYSGPTGSVAGVVVITGDEAPTQAGIEAIPKECLNARETYERLFREGLMRGVADVFVAVTGYEGYVPATRDVHVVSAKGCAFDTRTVGLTFGQALDVVSKDVRPYVPELLGGRATAQLVATPGGKPVRLYPEKPGRYVLIDSMRTFAAADVLVVAYPTFDVTGLDGKFKIDKIPVGKVKLNALLPAPLLTTEREITIEAGKTTNVDLELPFDLKAYEKAEKAAAREAESRGAAKPPAVSSRTNL